MDDLYPFDEFSDDYDGISPGLQEGMPAFERGLDVTMQHMRQRYGHRAVADFRFQRFMLIMNYLCTNIHAFDQGDYLVYGSPESGALASDHLLRAIHKVFTATLSLADMKEPTPEEIMASADSLRALQ